MGKATHVDPRSVASCAVLVSMIQLILKGETEISNIFNHGMEVGQTELLNYTNNLNEEIEN